MTPKHVDDQTGSESLPLRRCYLPTEKAAEILHMKASTLENMRYRRKGPPWTKIGGAVRYDESALYRWLDAQTVTEIPNSEP